MESVFDTPPSEDNGGEICFGECKEKVEKLKKDFLMLKKKIFCSQDLIKKYNDKVKENEQLVLNMQASQSQLKMTEIKLNKRNIVVQSDAVRLQLENEKLRKANEDVVKMREEYEIKIAGDKQYIQQLVCKLKEIEDQNLDKLMKMELEKSGLQSKVKELEREIRNLQKNCNKTSSSSPNKTNGPNKRGRKSLNNQAVVGLPALEDDFNCVDIDENIPKPLISQCDNTLSSKECDETSSNHNEAQKPIDVPEIVLENEFKIKVFNLDHESPKKPICIDKNIMTDEYYNLKDDPYPLFCYKCRNLLDSKPVDEILDGMQIKPLITEFSRSPIREQKKIIPVVHSNMPISVETLEEKLKKLEKRVFKMKQVQNSYKNVSQPFCNHSHMTSCCRDNSTSDSVSLMNIMTTFFNAMHVNKKKKKSRKTKLQHCKKKVYRKKNKYTNNWDIESLPHDIDNNEHTGIVLESLHPPIFTPLVDYTKMNRSFNCNTSRNYIENSEEINYHKIQNNDVEVEKIKTSPLQCKEKRKSDHCYIENQKNDDCLDDQKHNYEHVENQEDDNEIVNLQESSDEEINTEKIVNLNPSIEDSDNDPSKNTEIVNEITPAKKLVTKEHHEEKHLKCDINTRLNELYSSKVTPIELINSSNLNTSAVQKRKKGKINTNTVSVKSSLLTRLRQLRNKSTKLPGKIFRNEHLDNIERIEELNEPPIKKRRIAHVPKQDCSDDNNCNPVERSNEEQLILNRLRVTRSMAKFGLPSNKSLEKEAQNSVISENDLNINHGTNVTNDHCTLEQEHRKNSKKSVVHKKQVALNAELNVSEETHSNDEENENSDKTQGLNDKCTNEFLSNNYELDNNNKKTSLKKGSKMNKINEKNSDMLIDLEELIENEINEGIALENNPELFDESSMLSDQKLEKIEEAPASPDSMIEEAPASPDSMIEESPSSPDSNLEEFPASPDSKIGEHPASPDSSLEESPASPGSKIEESPASPDANLEESPSSPDSKIEESPASPDLKIEESPASPDANLEESPASPNSKHNITEIPSEPMMSNISNNLTTSNKFSKIPMCADQFYKDCVINLRNRTVAISPSKTTNHCNNKLFIQYDSSKTLLDQHLAQKKHKRTTKWSKFHNEAAMKLVKGAEEYIKMELKNLIDAETWSSLVNEQIVNNLKTINNRSIAKSVVELLIELSNLKEPLDRTFTPPAPMMTKNQQKIVTLLKKLDGTKNVIIDVLNNIEYAIFRMNSDITYEAVEELARIFTVLAKIKKDRERVRIMCCDALYCLQKKGLFIISAIITSWPEVLPSHQEDRFQYLPACIAYAVKTFKQIPNDVCIKVMQLNKLIRNLYNYPDEFLTSKSFVEKLLTDLMTPSYDRSVCTAIILLSKKEGSEWTFKNIISGGLLGMIVENKSSNVREALKLLGFLLKSFPVIDQSGNVKKIIDQLCAILDSGATSIDIQEGVVLALLSLSRHNFDRVAQSIILWQPPQSLSPELEEQLNIFFNLRTLNFWKQFKKKKNVINKIS